MGAKVPILVAVARVMGHGSNVDGAGLRSFGCQLNSEKWALERGSVGSQLDAASASAIQHVSWREFVLTHHLGAQGGDLPGRGQRPPLVGVVKQQTFGSSCVLGQLDQTLCARIDGLQGAVQMTTSKSYDVGSSHERFKRNPSGRKGSFRPFFTVENADDTDHVAFGVLVDSVNGENG